MIAKLTHQRLTKTNSKLFNSLLFVFCFFSALNYSFANVTTTKATGGTISCDKAANGTTPTFTVLGNIVITENVATDFSAGTNVTLSVNAPSGWIFDSTSVTGVVNVSFTAAMNITSAIVTSITSSIITITYTVVGTTKLDVMTISGIAVMPIEGGNPGVAVNLTKGGTGVIAGLASAGRVGVLSETVGAGKLYITLPGQTFVNATTFAGSGATGTPTQQTSGTAFSLLKLIDCDQFYNIITTYTGTKTISYSGASNGVTSPIFTTSLSFTSGQSTTTLTTTLKKAESISISATDGVLPAHPSTVLIVNPAVLNNFLVEDGNGGVVTSKSAGVSFNINVSARDVENNILSSGPNIYSGNCTLTSTGVLTSGGGVTSSFTAGVLNNYAVTIRPGGTFTLTAKNGTPTGVSNSFVVNNPYPTITTISPSCLARGALNFTLTVNGSNFNEASIVQLDGVSKTTTYISSTQLTASILASDVGSDGIKNISVSNPTPSGGVSSNASMTVSLTPVISSQPSSLSLCIGSSATFQVTASGFGISYQWKKNGVALVNGGTISGATSNVLTISSVALSDTSSSYIVEISSPCYSLVTSIAVSLNIDVLTIGGIVSGSTSVCSSTNSGSLTLSGFTGSILYWEFSLNNFSSAGTTIANTTSSQSYSNLTQTTYYRAVVKSGVCSIDYSSVAAVTVNALPAVPPNPTASSPQCMGNNVTLTRANTSGGIGYFWQITSAGTSMIDSNLTKIVSASGIYYLRTQNISSGCWSNGVGSVNVNLLASSSSSRSVSICNGSSTTLPDGLIKTLAGVYVSHIANAAGCDSTIMTTISILNNSFSSATQILNNGSTVTLPNGTVVSSAGTYTSTIPNYLGCDSVITTLVIAASSVSSSTTISSCKGDTIILPNGNSVAPIVPTDYVSTLTNASIYGTDSIITTHVLIKALPILSVTTTQILCYGGTASVSLSTTGGLAPYTYGQTPIVGLYQGAYTYYVTDANQCRNTVVTVVNPSPALLVLNATSNQIQCYAGKGSVTLQGVGGTPNYVYSGSALVNLLLGTYNYLVTDNKGCVATASAIILPAPTRLTGTILASPTSCIGNTGSATVNVAGGSPTYTYSWNTIPVQHTSIASNLAAGNYICTITDSRGCNLNAPTVVTNPALPKILFTGKTAFCPGAATTICATAGMTKYLWSNGDTTLCSSFSAIGVYSVTVTNSAGCTSSGSISIVAGGLPISTITGPDYICPGGSTTLSAPPGYTYQWIPSGTKQFLSVRTGGTYTVTIKNSAGCTSSSSKVVTSPLKVSINRLNGSCASAFLGSMSAVIAGGVPPYNYAWSNGATTSSISGLKVGSYNLQVVDSKGCMAVVASTITSVKAAIDYSRLVDAFNNNDIPLGRYIWFSAVVNIIYTGSYPVEIKFTDQNIASSRFNVNPKNARLIIDSTVTQATTVFSNSEWLTIAPPSSTGNYFISGYSYKVPTTILRNLSSVTWKGIWSASSQGVTSINWKWSAAVYSNFNTDCSLLGIKPVDDAINSSYLNMDPAGSPENYTLSVIQGARGNGNGDFVGTYTSVVTRTPCTNSSIVFARNNYNPTIQEELDPDFVVNAYPNPFTSQATIEFSRLDKTCETTIEIFNMSGQKIALLFQGTITSGEKYSTIFDGENLPEGIYIYRIATNDQVINGRLVLTK